VDFALPINATNFMIEYAAFEINHSEKQQCPRSVRPACKGACIPANRAGCVFWNTACAARGGLCLRVLVPPSMDNHTYHVRM